MVTECDICIIGGGPAGSVLAARLVSFGWDVVVVERAAFPRRHLGESLSPGVMPLLETIGADAAIKAAGFDRVKRVSVNWDTNTERIDPGAKGLLVDRGRFDQLLLERARDLGARILQPATALGRRTLGDGWALDVSAGGRRVEVRARFLADASGRSGITGHRRSAGARTVALHAYWTGSGLPTHPTIEAGADGWFWGVPLPDGWYNTLVFVAPGDLRAMKGTLNRKFHDLLATSSLLPRGIDAALAGPVRACDATPYLDESSVSDTFIRVGDAALALDPLSSSGVQKAIQTALAGSVVVNTLLHRPSSAPLARQYYLQSLSEASARHQAWAREYYGLVAKKRTSAFWQERAVSPKPQTTDSGSPVTEPLPPDRSLQLSPEVRIREVPCVLDRFIETRPAVCSPALDSPVAFLGGIELAPLLCQVRNGMTARELVHAWAPDLPPSKGMEIVRWLHSRGLLMSQARPSLAMERREP